MAPFIQVPPDYGDECDLSLVSSHFDPCENMTSNTRCVDIQGQGYCVCRAGFARRSSTDTCQSMCNFTNLYLNLIKTYNGNTVQYTVC